VTEYTREIYRFFAGSEPCDKSIAHKISPMHHAKAAIENNRRVVLTLERESVLKYVNNNMPDAANEFMGDRMFPQKVDLYIVAKRYASRRTLRITVFLMSIEFLPPIVIPISKKGANNSQTSGLPDLSLCPTFAKTCGGSISICIVSAREHSLSARHTIRLSRYLGGMGVKGNICLTIMSCSTGLRSKSSRALFSAVRG
jgi:hypothetical protein